MKDRSVSQPLCVIRDKGSVVVLDIASETRLLKEFIDIVGNDSTLSIRKTPHCSSVVCVSCVSRLHPLVRRTLSAQLRALLMMSCVLKFCGRSRDELVIKS